MSLSTRTTWAGIPTISAARAASRPCATRAAPVRPGSPGCVRCSTSRCTRASAPSSTCRQSGSTAARAAPARCTTSPLPTPQAAPEGCARTIVENPDLAIGVKLRFGPGLVWEYSNEPVKLARKAADMAGGVPMMMHITDSPIPLPELIEPMKPGDIVTHCYHGRANGIMGQEKQFVLKEVVEAQRHGIVFDCAHGRNHFSFRMIEKALDQGFLPDTISTDLTTTTATKGPVWDLPTTMSKLLHFGMSLPDIVRRATSAPAKILGYEGTVGTLKPGANADISLFELRDGNFDLTDSEGT